MFVIDGLDLGVIRRKASETLVISHASIIVPFLMGMGLAMWSILSWGAARFLCLSPFVAISVSITAFPVLARIVQERNLSKTPMGMLAIASAANNDVTAWCLLAAVIAVARAGSVTSAFFTIVLTALYILFMFYLVKPFLRKIGEFYNKQETVSKTLVAFIFLVLIISSYITEILGIHALFGAFLAGVVMPANRSFRRVMTERSRMSH
ncbi:MAG: cation:proton antiporter [Alistipes sp.]